MGIANGRGVLRLRAAPYAQDDASFLGTGNCKSHSGWGRCKIANCGLPMLYGMVDNFAVQVGPILGVLKIGLA